MDLRVLRYFLTVAKEQSFTKAAQQLHITQPTLSRQLAALEEELGTALFNRGGHSITLTDQGLLLKRRALEIIDLENRILDEFKGSEELVEGSFPNKRILRNNLCLPACKLLYLDKREKNFLLTDIISDIIIVRN